MKRNLERLWMEEDGFVLSTEMVMYGTVGVLGVGAGYTALRDSVNAELTDVAKAIGALDQSYCYSPVVGHCVYTAGSSFYDRADLPDGPQALPIVQDQYARPLVCADVFGPAQPHAVVPGPTIAPPRTAPVPVPAAPTKRVNKEEAAVIAPSKSVVVAEPAPAVVVGSPGLVPCCNGVPGGPGVNVMINPCQAGPYMVDVPEGYFNRAPGAWMGTPHYQVYVNGLNGVGLNNYGYAYAPAQAGVVKAPAGWDTIDLGFAKVGDDELKHIEKFSTAKCLHVLGSNVTDRGLGYIAEMDQLESLHLVGTQVTDAGLKQLRSLKQLRFLHLIGTKITDKGLASLVELKQLEELDVRGTAVTDAGLNELAKKLPTLRVIR
jgi:hypothetical protein